MKNGAKNATAQRMKMMSAFFIYKIFRFLVASSEIFCTRFRLVLYF